MAYSENRMANKLNGHLAVNEWNSAVCLYIYFFYLMQYVLWLALWKSVWFVLSLICFVLLFFFPPFPLPFFTFPLFKPDSSLLSTTSNPYPSSFLEPPLHAITNTLDYCTDAGYWDIAKGRTNIELREQFILADGVSQSMSAFKSKPSSSSSQRSASLSSAGPITKVGPSHLLLYPVYQPSPSFLPHFEFKFLQILLLFYHKLLHLILDT